MRLYRVYGENTSQMQLILANDEEAAKAEWKFRHGSMDEIPPITAIDVVPPPYARLMERDKGGITHCLATLAKGAAEASSVGIKDKYPDREVWVEDC